MQYMYHSELQQSNPSPKNQCSNQCECIAELELAWMLLVPTNCRKSCQVIFLIQTGRGQMDDVLHLLFPNRKCNAWMRECRGGQNSNPIMFVISTRFSIFSMIWFMTWPCHMPDMAAPRSNTLSKTDLRTSRNVTIGQKFSLLHVTYTGSFQLSELDIWHLRAKWTSTKDLTLAPRWRFSRSLQNFFFNSNHQV